MTHTDSISGPTVLLPTPGAGWRGSIRAVSAVLVGLLVAAIGLPLLQELHQRPLAAVKIAGEFQQVSRDSLQAMLAGVTDAGFIGVDIAELRRVALDHPWVKRVSVRRVWPDSLHVAVVERLAVVRWNADALLEADGSVFEPESTTVPNLPGLEGPPGRERDVLAMFRRLDDAIGALAGGISRLTLSSRGAWRVELAQGMTLVLGRSLDLPRLRMHVRAFPEIFQDRISEIESVDLRYTNGFAVRFQDVQANTTKGTP